MYAKKSLGQHFLKSERALDTIVDSANASETDLILEIGPGQGALTDKLIPFAGKIVAVEKDDELFETLKGKYSKGIRDKRLDLIHDDILDFNPETLRSSTLIYKLVANIPYNITGAILEKFLSANYQPERMVLLVQKEVAERIVARNNKESILSISVKVYGIPKYVETVKAGSFAPAPKVDSAILLVENISKGFFEKFSEESFFVMLRAGFKSKRKKLSSNLATIFNKEKVSEAFNTLGIGDNTRAEDLTLKEWKRLGEKLI